MSFGKGGSTTYTTPQLTDEQRQQIQAQNELFTSTIAPNIKSAVSGATNLYQSNAPGVLNAAQNLAGTASQAQNVLGAGGESAYTSGINALQNIASPAYQQAEMNAALMPAEAQYAQNIAQQQAQFGGAGQLGSARQALAQTQLAGTAAAQQQATAAQVLKDISAQRLAAGQSLAGIGLGGIGQALGAAGQQVTAAMTPQQLYNQYASVLFGTPQASYNPNFQGTQATTTTQAGNKFGISI